MYVSIMHINSYAMYIHLFYRVIKHDDFVRRMADVYTKVDWKN